MRCEHTSLFVLYAKMRLTPAWRKRFEKAQADLCLRAIEGWQPPVTVAERTVGHVLGLFFEGSKVGVLIESDEIPKGTVITDPVIMVETSNKGRLVQVAVEWSL